jgi:hypothetical protein
MSKYDNALREPSWAEVLIGAGLSLVLGVVLAVAHLVLKPVTIVSELPKSPVAGEVYFLEGSTDTNKGNTWLRKRQAFLDGQSIDLTEEELNTAVANPIEKPKGGAGQPAPAATPAPANVTKAANTANKDTKANKDSKANPANKANTANVSTASNDALLTPGSVNFRIEGGQVQVGVPVNVNLLDATVIIQATGGFVKKGDTFVFAPKVFRVGSCAVDRLPMVEGLIMGRLFAAQGVPKELTDAWAKLANVSVDGKTLKLAMP